MAKRQRWMIVLTLLAALLLAACGGGAEAPVAEAPAPDTAQSDEEAATPTEAPTAEPTEEPTEEPEPTAEPTEEAESSSDSSTTTQSNSPQDIESINSFRMRLNMQVEGEAFADGGEMSEGTIEIEASIIKDPPAQQVRMLFDTADEEMAMFGDGIELIQVGDQAYTKFGGSWIEVPADQAAIDMNDFLFIRPEDIAEDLDDLEEVGDETVNGRETTHLRGNKELFAKLAEENEEDFDLSEVDEAQMDLWLDKEENFIVKMELVAAGKGLNRDEPDLDGSIQILLEYYDINEDFEIEFPDDVADATSLDDMIPDELVLDPSALLGFDLELPEGASVDVYGNFVEIVAPLTVDEAVTFVEDTFASAGYELNADDSVLDAGLLYFDLGEQRISVFLTELDEGTEILMQVDGLE